MKSLLFLFLFFLFSFKIPAQQIISRSRTVSNYNLEGKVFNKVSGEKISNKQLMELLKEKPGLELQHLYGKYGELEKALYDPNEPYKKYSRDPELRTKIGENFPEFVFKTIEGEEFGKDQLNGKWVLIHFNHLTQFIKKPVWDKLYLDLQKAKKNYSIECFSLFAYEEDLKTSFGEYQPIIHLVNNGRGFFERYHIIKSPTSVLINPDGLVIQYYFESEAIEFLPFLETQEKHHLNQPN